MLRPAPLVGVGEAVGEAVPVLDLDPVEVLEEGAAAGVLELAAGVALAATLAAGVLVAT